MLTLGIETVTERVSVALGDHDGVLGSIDITRGRRHAETLTPAIEFLCRQADVKIDEVAVVAVDVGPGLFTGMRVGIAAAKAVALALHVPMIAMSSLDLLAYPLRRTDQLIASVIDARKGEVFYAFFRQNDNGIQRVLEPTVGSVDDLKPCAWATAQCVITKKLLLGSQPISLACRIHSPAHRPWLKWLILLH